MKNNIGRSLIEIGFIIFLFYSNLLMGEFTRSGLGQQRGLLWAFKNIFSVDNFFIAIAAASVGYSIFEFLRKRH